MPWFNKKRNPVERRLSELDEEIAALEARLREQQLELEQRAQQRATAKPTQPQQQPCSVEDNHTSTHGEKESPQKSPPSRPRFRTTALPNGGSMVHGIEPHEVDFFARRDRPVDFSLDAANEPPATSNHPSPKPAPAETNPSQRLVDAIFRRFQKPKSQDPRERLASYLTTGSFQTLKPLRYERRIARNRLIVLMALLAVVAFILYSCITR